MSHIEIEDYAFSVREAELLSGVTQRNIRNWIERGVLTIGKRHFTRRWTFNLLDVLQIRMMDDLAVRMQLPSATLGKSVAFAAGKVKEWRDGKLPGRNTNTILAIDEDGEWLVGSVSIDHHAYRVAARGDINQAMRRSHIVVPVTAMFEDILSKLEELERVT